MHSALIFYFQCFCSCAYLEYPKQITSKYINSLKSNTKKSNANEKQFVAGVLMCFIAGKSFLKIPKGIT